jgi:hypothetical protein
MKNGPHTCPAGLTCPWCSRIFETLKRTAGTYVPPRAEDHIVCVYCGGLAELVAFGRSGLRAERRRWKELEEPVLSELLDARRTLRGDAAILS